MVQRTKLGKKILVIFNAISTEGITSLSGGDRIVVELFKRWQNNFQEIRVITCRVGEKLFAQASHALHNFIFSVIHIPKKYYQNLFILYVSRTLKGLMMVSKLQNEKFDFVYSSSDFWPDVIPAFWLKLIKPKTTWLAGFYMFAPNPIANDSPYKDENFLKGLLYYLTQLPIYFIVKTFADYVLVTSEPDVEKFITSKRPKEKIIVVQGGVEIIESEKYLADRENIISPEKRKYDACFVGRFHYQKGVEELIDIWKRVCNRIPNATLAMIGTGPLEEKVKRKIIELNLNKNINLFGFRDGKEKYGIFKNSKIILHPATYDSGGMAAAEGMAWGLPGVSFDLPALKSYYPKGMIKTKRFDLDEFANNIIELLHNQNRYNKISENAHDLIKKSWDWNKKSNQIFNKIFC